MRTAAYLDIEIDQGSTFELQATVKDNDRNPVSLALATVAGKLRESPESAAAIVAFTGTIVSEEDGQFKVTLSAAQTAAIPVTASGNGKRKLTKYLYDIEITFGDGTVQRVLEGLALVSPEVSR